MYVLKFMVYTKLFNNNTFTCKNDYIVNKKSKSNRIACIGVMICIHYLMILNDVTAHRFDVLYVVKNLSSHKQIFSRLAKHSQNFALQNNL